MPITVASAHLADDSFLRAFERCELPLASFRHGDHLRLAWLYLHRKPFDDALRSVQHGIYTFAAHHGAGHIFHHTLTQAWVTLLASHQEPSFDDFLNQNEPRLNQSLLHRFWLPETLASPAARSAWIAPDRSPLPALLHD